MGAWKLAGSFVPLGLLAGVALLPQASPNPAAATLRDSFESVERAAVESASESNGASPAGGRPAVVHAAGRRDESVIQQVEGRMWSWGWGWGRKKDEEPRSPSRSASNIPRQPQPSRFPSQYGGNLSPEPDPRFDRRTPAMRALEPTPSVSSTRTPQPRATSAPRPLEIVPELAPAPSATDSGWSVPRRGTRLEPVYAPPTPAPIPAVPVRATPTPVARTPVLATPPQADPFTPSGSAGRVQGPGLQGPTLVGPTPVDEIEPFDASNATAEPIGELPPPAPARPPVFDESREIQLPVSRATRQPAEIAPAAPSPDFTPSYGSPNEPFDSLEPAPESRTRTAPAPRTAGYDPRKESRNDERGSRFGDGFRRLFPLMRR